MPRENSKPPPRGSQKRWVEDIGPFLTLGIQLALAVIIFFFLGRWLDERWGTAPWLTLAGLAVGVAGGFLQFFRSVAAISRKEAADRATEKDRK